MDNKALLVLKVLDLPALREKIEALRLELKKAPSYDKARDLQRLLAELNVTASNNRRAHMKLVYSFERDLIDTVVERAIR